MSHLFFYALVDFVIAVTGKVTLAKAALSVDPAMGVHCVIKHDML
jgi:hypothetical protein